MCERKDGIYPFHGKRSVGAADFEKQKKVATDVGPAGQQEDLLKSDEETLAASDQPAAHATMPEPNYEGLTVVELRSQLRSRNLSKIGNKAALVARLQQADASEATAGHSAMLQDIPPARLDAAAGSAGGEPTTVATVGDLPEVAGADTPGPVETAGSAEGEPTTVATVGELPVMAGADTPGPVENAPPGGEATVAGDDGKLLGVDVSAPPTAQGVAGEVDAQHGEVGEKLAAAAVLTPKCGGRAAGGERGARGGSSFDTKCGGRAAGGERRKRREHCRNAGRRATNQRRQTHR
jgi:hypothetical protein